MTSLGMRNPGKSTTRKIPPGRWSWESPPMSQKSLAATFVSPTHHSERGFPNNDSCDNATAQLVW
eukprot:3910992-Rhodomonas_salina.1